MLDEQRLLHFGNHQHFGLRVSGEHRALVVGEVTVATPVFVEAVAQVLRFVFVAAVGGVIHVQAGHLVKADQPIHGTLGQVGVHPVGELFVATVIEDRLDRRHQHFETGRYVTLPDQRVDADFMAALLTLQGDAHEVTLQAAEREVFIKHECQLHQGCSFASNSAPNWFATRSGFRRVKHMGHSRSVST